MNLNTCIQQSYSERYQNLAKQDFESTAKNFFSKRVKGVVMLPFAAIADAFKCIFSALCELKSAVTDRANYRDHLTSSTNYVAFAALFLGKACVAPVVNAINPKIYSAAQDALNEQQTNALAGKDTTHADALNSLQAQHASALAEKDAAHADALNTLQAQHTTALAENDTARATALEAKDREISQIRSDHITALTILKSDHQNELNQIKLAVQLKDKLNSSPSENTGQDVKHYPFSPQKPPRVLTSDYQR